jgi:hypothetical protein
MTISRWRKLIFSTLLTGAFLALPASFAFAQYEPNEKPAGTPVDIRQDTRQINWLQRHIEEQRERLRRDQRRYGPKSAQAQADRQRLWAFNNQLNQLRRDRAQDRRQFNRRHDRDGDRR